MSTNAKYRPKLRKTNRDTYFLFAPIVSAFSKKIFDRSEARLLVAWKEATADSEGILRMSYVDFYQEFGLERSAMDRAKASLEKKGLFDRQRRYIPSWQKLVAYLDQEHPEIFWGDQGASYEVVAPIEEIIKKGGTSEKKMRRLVQQVTANEHGLKQKPAKLSFNRKMAVDAGLFRIDPKASCLLTLVNMNLHAQRRAARHQKKSNGDGTTSISLRRMAGMSNICLSSVHYLVRKLQEMGYLSRVSQDKPLCEIPAMLSRDLASLQEMKPGRRGVVLPKRIGKRWIAVLRTCYQTEVLSPFTGI